MILVPDSVPIFVGFDCPEISCKNEEVIIPATIEDIKRWYDEEQRNIRIKVNLFISLFSIFLGLIIFIVNMKNRDK